MHLTILAAILTVSSTALLPSPPNYSYNPPNNGETHNGCGHGDGGGRGIGLVQDNPSQNVGSHNGGQILSQGFDNIGISNRNEGGGIGFVQANPTGCGLGEIRGSDGGCQQAEVSKQIFLVEAPQLHARDDSHQADLPKPKLHYNIVFVRAPEGPDAKDALVVPPPQHKTLVYVLNKGKEEQEQQIIQMQTPNHQPEVFFVNYNEGENPQLPIGIDLESALASVQNLEGRVVEGGQGGLSDDASQGGQGVFIAGGSQGGQGGFIAGGTQGGQGGIITSGTQGGQGGQGGFIAGGTQGGQGGQGGFIAGGTQGGQGGQGGFIAGGSQEGQGGFIAGGTQGGQGGFIAGGSQGGQGGFIAGGTQGGQGGSFGIGNIRHEGQFSPSPQVPSGKYGTPS